MSRMRRDNGGSGGNDIRSNEDKILDLVAVSNKMGPVHLSSSSSLWWWWW